MYNIYNIYIYFHYLSFTIYIHIYIFLVYIQHWPYGSNYLISGTANPRNQAPVILQKLRLDPPFGRFSSTSLPSLPSLVAAMMERGVLWEWKPISIHPYPVEWHNIPIRKPILKLVLECSRSMFLLHMFSILSILHDPKWRVARWVETASWLVARSNDG